MSTVFRLIFTGTAGALMCSAPLAAQDAEEHPEEHLEEVVVTGSLVRDREFDLLQGTNVLAGEALDRAMASSLGEVLDKLPGLSQTAFGPNLSRPIVRGLGGDRIRILEGGIGSIDASSTSPDHDVSSSLATAKRIEVLRGPATLLYGNNAVGGVVNIIDGRIPDAIPDNEFTGDFRGSFGSAADEVSVAGQLDARLADKLVLHVDGAYLDAGDTTIPGYAESSILRAFEGEAGDVHAPGIFGTAENTAMRKKSGTLGLSWVNGKDFFGVSASVKANQYGIPSQAHKAEPGTEGPDGAEEENVRIDLDQVRVDMAGAWFYDDSFIKEVRLRAGYADYDHTELEGEEIGTIFRNEGYEARLHMVHRPLGGFKGAFGIQRRYRNFEALGAEAFTPASVTRQTGLFLVEEYSFDNILLEGGARIERQSVSSAVTSFDAAYTGVSLSGGAAWRPADNWMLGFNIYRTERAPNAEELLSDGPHLATGSFELGDRTLQEETARGGELTLKYSREHFNFGLNLYRVNYDGFITERYTGEWEDGLPVLQYTQSDAVFKGGEIEANATLYHTDDKELILSGAVDYVRATDTATNAPLPRIPPLSVHLGLDFKVGKFDFGAELEMATKQDRVSENELATKGWERLDLTAVYHLETGNMPIELQMQVRNLLDAEIRHHTSQLKDRMPAAGRDIRLSARVAF